MELTTQRPPNGAVYGEVRIGRGSRRRQHRHAVVSHLTPNSRGHGGLIAQLRTPRNFAQFSGLTLALLVWSYDDSSQPETLS